MAGVEQEKVKKEHSRSCITRSHLIRLQFDTQMSRQIDGNWFRSVHGNCDKLKPLACINQYFLFMSFHSYDVTGWLVLSICEFHLQLKLIIRHHHRIHLRNKQQETFHFCKLFTTFYCTWCPVVPRCCELVMRASQTLWWVNGKRRSESCVYGSLTPFNLSHTGINRQTRRKSLKLSENSFESIKICII